MKVIKINKQSNNKKIIEFLEFLPPSKIICQTLGLNEIKALYVLCYNSDHYINAVIDYEPISWENNGLGYFLREILFAKFS